MSEPKSKPAPKIVAHRVTVAGQYTAFREAGRELRVSGASRGARRGRERKDYRMDFTVPLNHGAPLTYVLASLLGPALRAKDPNFYGVATHELVGKPIDIFE